MENDKFRQVILLKHFYTTHSNEAVFFNKLPDTQASLDVVHNTIF
jgi:hypothetical protein